MSYRHLTDNYLVTFEDESNFLEARLEYLNGVFEGVFFADFLQLRHSEGRYEITSIVRHEPYSFSFSGDENTIYVEDALSNLDTFTPQVMTTTHGDGSSIVGIATGDTDNSGYANVALAAENIFYGDGLTFSDHQALSKIKEEKEGIKEEPVIDPIDNRFDILDL